MAADASAQLAKLRLKEKAGHFDDADEDDEDYDEDDYDEGDEEERTANAARNAALDAAAAAAAAAANEERDTHLRFYTDPEEAPSSSNTIYQPLSCMFCGLMDVRVDSMLKHLLDGHDLVIASVDQIANFSGYLKYWSKRFADGHKITEFATAINAQPYPGAMPTSYFMLGPGLPEDKKLREDLAAARLAIMIAQQQAERNDSCFRRRCLFCKDEYRQRNALFTHMFQGHTFNVGLPDNLVFIHELLDLLQQKLDHLQCIYCLKTFKNTSVLRLHMKKKKHFKINARNQEFDRFYMINYLDSGRTWQEIAREPDGDDDEIHSVASSGVTATSESSVASAESSWVGTEAGAAAETWEDWEEDDPKAATICLFCPITLSTPGECLGHMAGEHEFDIHKLRAEWDLDFYATIRLVNYIRRRVYNTECPACSHAPFESQKQFLAHARENNHFTVQRDAPFWQDPEYLIPTFDDDPLLRCIDDDDDDIDMGAPGVGADVAAARAELDEQRRELQARLDKYGGLSAFLDPADFVPGSSPRMSVQQPRMTTASELGTSPRATPGAHMPGGSSATSGGSSHASAGSSGHLSAPGAPPSGVSPRAWNIPPRP